jgi:hypothetical protein
MADQDTKSPQQLTFEWSEAADVPLIFADVLHWRTLTDRCYLTFGQLHLVPKGDLSQAVPETGANIQPVVRLAVTPDILRVWAKMMEDATKKYPQPTVVK